MRAYAVTYLKEEVQAEQLIRKLEPFRSFLEVAAQCNGKVLNFSNIARDVGTDTKTIQSYFEVLRDTLLGTLLQPYHRSIRKRQSQNPKFYFFDLGVTRSLARVLRQTLQPKTSAYGEAFEHFLIVEMHRLNEYSRSDFRLSYLRTKDDAEIDVVIERPGAPLALIEV